MKVPSNLKKKIMHFIISPVSLIWFVLFLLGKQEK